jgi:hypothetical protein
MPREDQVAHPSAPAGRHPEKRGYCGIAEAAEFLACNPKKVRQLLRVRYSDLDAVLPRVPCVPDV